MRIISGNIGSYAIRSFEAGRIYNIDIMGWRK